MGLREERDVQIHAAGLAFGHYVLCAADVARALQMGDDAARRAAHGDLTRSAQRLKQLLFRVGVDASPRTELQDAGELSYVVESELQQLGDSICRALGQQSEWVFLLTAYMGGAIAGAAMGLSEELLEPNRINARLVADKLSVPKTIIDECFQNGAFDALLAFLNGRTVGTSKVFIAHGQDDGALHAVARLLEQLGLCPIVLREQPSRGRTIIEKFVDYADVEFAVVLLTADDLARPRGSTFSELVPRARQNVLLELGFFLGKLGRDRVCAVHESGVEVPSDYHGVLFVPLDADGAWHLKLAQELKAVGLPVDLNALAR